MRLVDFRKHNELTQKKFGAMLTPAASPSLVSQWECGITRVTLDYSLEIRRVTGGLVTPEDCAAMFVERAKGAEC